MAESNPILPVGRFIHDRVTKEASIGDGVHTWEQLPKVGMKDAPIDGKAYVRRNGEWVELDPQFAVILIPPTVTSAGSAEALLNSTFTYQISSTAQDMDVTNYISEDLPPSSVFDAATGVITWNIGTSTDLVGTYTFTVGVTTEAGTATKEVVLNVYDPNSFRPIIDNNQSLELEPEAEMDTYQVQGTNTTLGAYVVDVDEA